VTLVPGGNVQKSSCRNGYPYAVERPDVDDLIVRVNYISAYVNTFTPPLGQPFCLWVLSLSPQVLSSIAEFTWSQRLSDITQLGHIRDIT
jgi:hypothetical protein